MRPLKSLKLKKKDSISFNDGFEQLELHIVLGI